MKISAHLVAIIFQTTAPRRMDSQGPHGAPENPSKTGSAGEEPAMRILFMGEPENQINVSSHNARALRQAGLEAVFDESAAIITGERSQVS